MEQLNENQQEAEASEVAKLAQAIEKLANVLDRRLAELTAALQDTRRNQAIQAFQRTKAGSKPNMELVEDWIRKIGRTCEGRILRLLAEKHPLQFTRAEIAAQLRYSKDSGPFKQAISTLKKHQLIAENDEGRLTLHENLLT